MKRSPMPRSTTPLKRSEIKRTSTWQRRKPLKAQSLKKLASLPARRRCVEIVLARDQGCVFWRHVHAVDPTVVPGIRGLPDCGGPLDVHEPGHRSQGADPTDPDACVAVCRRHHSWLHEHPTSAKLLGL